jgi:hypothetical protein
MNLPAALLAVLSLTGCETQVDFEHRSGPEAPTATEKGPVERVEIEMPREFAKAPAAAPIRKPVAKPTLVVKPKAKPVVEAKANACGPCGMG